MKAVVVFWSGTGNTEAMANEIVNGMKETGAEVALLGASEFSSGNIGEFEKFAFGCPSMGVEELEETEFAPMFSSVEKLLSGKEILLFGSYGWGDGEWMREWQKRCEAASISVFNGEGLIVNEAPDVVALTQCREAGKKFANS